MGTRTAINLGNHAQVISSPAKPLAEGHTVTAPQTDKALCTLEQIQNLILLFRFDDFRVTGILRADDIASGSSYRCENFSSTFRDRSPLIMRRVTAQAGARCSDELLRRAIRYGPSPSVCRSRAHFHRPIRCPGRRISAVIFHMCIRALSTTQVVYMMKSRATAIPTTFVRGRR